MLFPCIPMHRVLPPVLHILLGLTNYLDRHIIAFLRTHIEPDLPDIYEKKMEIATQSNYIANCEHELDR
jgi:hypothetical protein